MDEWLNLELLRDPARFSLADGLGSRRQRIRALLDEIAALTLFREPITFWRGHANTTWQLTPRVPREIDNDPVVETAALVEAAAEARHSWREGVLFRQLKQLELLALLQHLDSPTALLDLTADPLVGLYFATLDDPDVSEPVDGLLIGWNARGWLDLTPEKTRYPGIVGGKRAYPEIVALLREMQTLAWLIPPVVSDRIVVQRSRMLVAPIDPVGSGHWASPLGQVVLPDLPPDWDGDDLALLFSKTGRGRRKMPAVVGFRIPRDLKVYIQETLRDNYGISHYTLFPEPGGFSARPR